jgi:hypothetical protein
MPFLAVFLGSIRNNAPDHRVTVVWSQLPRVKLEALRAINPEVNFIASEDMPIVRDRRGRIGQKMDFVRSALEIVDDQRIVFLDCDMLVRAPLDFEWKAIDDILFTVREGRIKINAGFFALQKNSRTLSFLNDWSERTRKICSDKIELERAAQTSGGPGQHALLQIIGDPGLAFSNSTVSCNGHTVELHFLPCSLYNETYVVPLTGPARILHYFGTWHKVFWKGTGNVKGDYNNYREMYYLWMDTLRREEVLSGTTFEPWGSRNKIRIKKLLRRSTVPT